MAGIVREGMAVYTSINRETSFGTGIATARKHLLTDYVPATDEQELIDNEGKTVAAGEGANAVQVLRKWHQARMGWSDVDCDALAWVLAYLIGPPTNAAADTDAFLHTYAEPAGRSIYSFTYEELLIAGTQSQIPGAFVAGASLRIMRSSLASLSADIIAKGPRASGTGTGSFVASEPICKGDGIAAYIGTAYDGVPALGGADLSSPTTLTALVPELDLAIVNIRDPRRLWVPGGTGGLMGRAERGYRTFDISATIEVADLTYSNYVHSGAQKAIAFEWNSGVVAGATTQNYGWKIIFPAVIFENVRSSFDDEGRLRQSFRLKIITHATYGRFQAAVWNKTATYGAAA